MLDLDYPEDSTAETDMNVVMTGDGRFVEVQGTAEGAGAAFDRAVLGDLLDLATAGCAELTVAQQAALAAPGPGAARVTRRLVLATRNEHKVARAAADPRAGSSTSSGSRSSAPTTSTGHPTWPRPR